MTQQKPKRSSVIWRIGILVALLVVAIFILVTIFNKQAVQSVSNFNECKNAGGVILESYPEQCSIDNRSFTNTNRSALNIDREYIGLTEQAALDKAADTNKVARVVKRDSQDLPITMDFSPGRLNLYIQDGKVYMVQVEGSPQE